ncbi:hypothetical protein F7725_028465 [Dissostichus mawsoni]|uniref:Uncharacterized protein n=1 Tax=Dissostichus mawsoni TaxID=36200 RepID=A0A7J5XGZ5_DISMA|nr:hypothetical protein F7725_028465 [Dissostichus mawsoni]
MMVSLVNYTDSDESQSPSRIAIHDDSSQAWSPGTDIELKEDKDIFPRLRRTKSIQVSNIYVEMINVLILIFCYWWFQYIVI